MTELERLKKESQDLFNEKFDIFKKYQNNKYPDYTEFIADFKRYDCITKLLEETLHKIKTLEQ